MIEMNVIAYFVVSRAPCMLMKNIVRSKWLADFLLFGFVLVSILLVTLPLCFHRIVIFFLCFIHFHHAISFSVSRCRTIIKCWRLWCENHYSVRLFHHFSSFPKRIKSDFGPHSHLHIFYELLLRHLKWHCAQEKRAQHNSHFSNS